MDNATDWAQTGILGIIVAAVVISGLKGAWIFGRSHDRIVREVEQRRADREADCERALADRQAAIDRRQAELDEWKALALEQVGIVERTAQETSRLIYRAVADDDVERR